MWKSALYLSLTVGVLVGFSPAANAVSVNWGSLATSSVCPFFDCTGPAVTSIEAGEAGMEADVSTSINYNAGPIDPAASSSFAQATLSGSALTPTLGVFAASSSTDLALATASGIQGYTNMTGDTQQITLDLMLSTHEISPGGAVTAFAAVFYASELEISGDDVEDAVLSFDIGSADAADAIAPPISATPATQTKSFSFEVLAGQDFLIWAGLQALAISTGGVADASNTLTVALSDSSGAIDPGLYDPASLRDVSAIPIPPSAWLFFSGIWIIGSLAHYRKSLARG